MKRISEMTKSELATKNIWMLGGYSIEDVVEFYKHNIIACSLPVGRQIGNLEEIMKSDKDLNTTLKIAYGSPDSRIIDGRNLCINFYERMQIEDIVIVRFKFESVLTIGRVVGDYYYDETQQKYKHCRRVEWEKLKDYSYPENLKIHSKWFCLTKVEKNLHSKVEDLILNALA